MQKPIEFENRGKKISGILHLPDVHKPPIVIMSHGFTGNKNSPLLVTLANYLEKNGFAVLRFDYRGNGQSSGKFEDMTTGGMIEDLTSAIDYVCENEQLDSNRIGLLGHSLGTTIMILNHDNRVKSTCLISPVVIHKNSFTLLFDNFAEKGWQQDFFRQGYVFINKHGGYKVKKDLWDQLRLFDMKREIGEFNKPTLFLCGNNDDMVDLKDFRDLFYKASEPKEKVEIMGDHVFHGNEEMVCGPVIKWFNKWLKI